MGEVMHLVGWLRPALVMDAGSVLCGWFLLIGRALLVSEVCAAVGVARRAAAVWSSTVSAQVSAAVVRPVSVAFLAGPGWGTGSVSSSASGSSSAARPLLSHRTGSGAADWSAECSSAPHIPIKAGAPSCPATGALFSIGWRCRCWRRCWARRQRRPPVEVWPLIGRRRCRPSSGAGSGSWPDQSTRRPPPLQLRAPPPPPPAATATSIDPDTALWRAAAVGVSLSRPWRRHAWGGHFRYDGCHGGCTAHTACRQQH